MESTPDVEKLKQQLFEATETLRAIREGEVDAFVLHTSGRYHVESLAGADSPYRVLVESMRDGAVTVSEGGEVLYCNRPFARKVGVSGPAAVGQAVDRWLEPDGGLPALLEAAQHGEASQDAVLHCPLGGVPTSVTACALPNDDGSTVYCLVVTDLSDRVAAGRLRIEQAVLARQRAELQAILSRLPFAVLLTEPRDSVSYVNPVAEALLAQHPSLRTQAGETAARVLSGAGIDAEEVTLTSNDGTEAAFRIQATRFEVEGLPPRALVVFEDVTASTQAQRARERQQQLREAFVGILGHDLRSPLMAITSAAGTLQVTQEPALALRVSHVISRAATRMTHLIDDMLDLTLSRIGGGIPLKRVESNLERIVRSTIDEIAATKPHAKVELRVSGDPGGVWDPARLAQVVSNLLANALEHGAPEAPVAIVLDGTSPEHVWFSVANRGDPIPSELLSSIFDPFRRADGRVQRRGGGVGLGLYIAERIVSAHGGTIVVQSSHEQGTTFRVELPRRA